MVLDKFKEKLLQHSDQYNFYKKFYEEHVNDETIQEYIKKEEKNRKLINEQHKFLSTIFLYHTLEPTPFFTKFKELGYQLITFVDNVCVKYDLDWWAFYGTLLGAVRHNDFVPWDDDLDIGMMRADYNKFYDVIHDEIKENNLNNLTTLFKHKSHGVETGKSRWLQLKYFHPDLRVSVMGLDIFPFDYLKNNNDVNFNKNYHEARDIFYEEGRQGVDIDSMLKHYYDSVGCSFEKTGYIIPGVEGVHGDVNMFSLNIVETGKFFPLEKIDFGNIQVNIPNSYHEHLSMYYKKYMALPKKVRNHNRMDNFRKNKDIEVIIDQAIGEFKDANNNF